MQEDPRSSTCCCTPAKVLPFGGLTFHSLNIESVLEGLEIVFDSKWPESTPPTHSVKLPKVEAKLDTDWHMWSWCMENPPRLRFFLGSWSLYQSVGCNANDTHPLPWKAKQSMLDLELIYGVKLLDVSFGMGVSKQLMLDLELIYGVNLLDVSFGMGVSSEFVGSFSFLIGRGNRWEHTGLWT